MSNKFSQKLLYDISSCILDTVAGSARGRVRGVVGVAPSGGRGAQVPPGALDPDGRLAAVHQGSHRNHEKLYDILSTLANRVNRTTQN